jgi:hypothetical protein
LGGNDEPGSFRQVDSIRVNPHGTIELDSLLVAYECSNEELGNDRILVRFNGQQVRYLDRVGVTRHFLRINPAVFYVDSLAQVGGVDLREGGTFPLEVLREGSACSGEYFLPGENSPNLLFTLRLQYPRIQVVLDPDSATLDPGESRSFTASVTGTDSTEVTWEVGGGDWSINGNTLSYTAGNSPGVYRIIARSVVDTARADTAVVQIGESCPTAAPAAVSGLFNVPSCEAVTLSVSPAVTTVLVEGSTTFAAAVSGTSNTSVTWTATGGTIDAAGVYTAGTVPGLYKVFARSIADNSVVDSAQVHVVTLIPLITYRGTGSIAQARGFASTAFGGSYTYNESARIDTLATEGSVSVSGGGAAVTNGSTTAMAQGTSSVAMNLDVQSGRLVAGTAEGSLTATARTDGTGTGSAGAETNTSFAIEFTVNSFSKIHLIVKAGISGACVGRGTTVLDHLGASPSRITLVSPTQDFNQEVPLLIGRNILNVTVTCFPNTSTSSGIVGTQTGSANFTVDFAFKPQ